MTCTQMTMSVDRLSIILEKVSPVLWEKTVNTEISIGLSLEVHLF